MRSRVLLGSGIVLATLWTACGGTGGTDDGGLTGTGAVGTGGTTGAGGKSAAGGSFGVSGKGGSGGSIGLVGGSGGSVGGTSAGVGGSGGSIAAGGSAGKSAGVGGGGAAGGPLMCAANTADCNMKPDDKCETHIDLDVSNCGKCGNVCPVPMNGTATCAAGMCASSCVTGFMDCDGNAANGCETKTSNDPTHCGSCTNVCPSGGGATAMCATGMCGLTCAMGTGDCNHMAADGCESNLNTDPKNCGSCGMDCMGGSCVSGACSCAGETSKAKKLPLDMFIMMDQSGSMSDPVGDGSTDKWGAVTTALNAFVMDPASDGLGVGIQYFGLFPFDGFCDTDADCKINGTDYGACDGLFCASSDSCSASDYAKAEVEIATLPGVGPAITKSLAMHSPTTSTPTAPALAGAIQHSKAWATAHPDHVVIAVLATDGDPSECDPTDIPSIAAIAMTGATQNPRVRTFVIGVGTSTASLNSIAMGGGTDSAFIVDTNMDVVKQFQAALTKIQGTALGCEYTLPVPSMGTLDPTKVNVVYTPGNGMPAVTLGKVDNMAACTAAGGWYYDNDAMPTKILLCAATCTTVSTDSTGSIDIQLGCATKKE